jgi:hypothetical protein
VPENIQLFFVQVFYAVKLHVLTLGVWGPLGCMGPFTQSSTEYSQFLENTSTELPSRTCYIDRVARRVVCLQKHRGRQVQATLSTSYDLLHPGGAKTYKATIQITDHLFERLTDGTNLNTGLYD